MPISGIVLTIDSTAPRKQELRERLDRDERFVPGEVDGFRWPIVCDTDTLDEHRAAWRDLERMPGVQFVELAYHDFSDVEDFGDRPPSRRDRS